MRTIFLLLTILSCLFCSFSYAVGPEDIARSDRSLWPYKLTDNAEFDKASRYEILSFMQAIIEKEKYTESDLLDYLKVKSVDMDSVKAWREQTKKRLLNNYLAASVSCSQNEKSCKKIADITQLEALSTDFDKSLPDNLHAWRDNARNFHQRYVYELMRLASLFPKVTSEIAVFGKSEITGADFPDKHFLLSFDDGPTPKNGETDHLLTMLKDEKHSGVFFMLGDHLQTRLLSDNQTTLRSEYQGMCVASHGMEHQSHAKWDKWRESLEQSKALIDQTFGDLAVSWFRPPYGQRLPESQGFVFDKTILWNIDSQDWNNKITAPQVSDRVLSLMLLWRRGIILFHDIHPKAVQALPVLFERTRDDGIVWEGCQGIMPIIK